MRTGNHCEGAGAVGRAVSRLAGLWAGVVVWSGVALGIGPVGGDEAAWSGPSAISEDEVRSVVSELIADAEMRTSLLESGARAGHDGKFFIASEDGNFRLNIGGQLQFRYNLNFRNKDEVVNEEDFEAGFNQPRTRVYFAGNAEEPGLFYRVMLDFRQSGGVGFLQDVWVGYDFDNGWRLRAGQGFTAFMREWAIGDFKLFSVERSFQALVFGQFRSQFAEARYQNENLRVTGTFSDGFRSANTDLGGDPADWALTGRAEWKFAGEWKRIDDEFRSAPGSEYAGSIGAAAHFERGPEGGVGSEQELLAWTADVLVKGDGWNAMLAGVGYRTGDEAGISGADFEDFSFMGQVGVHVTEKAEIVGRYEIILPDDDRVGNDNFNILMLGVNYYLRGQAARFSVAAYWFLDETTGTVAGNFADTGGRNPVSSAFGALPSANDDQVTIMAQFQLLF